MEFAEDVTNWFGDSCRAASKLIFCSPVVEWIRIFTIKTITEYSCNVLGAAYYNFKPCLCSKASSTTRISPRCGQPTRANSMSGYCVWPSRLIWPSPCHLSQSTLCHAYFLRVSRRWTGPVWMITQSLERISYCIALCTCPVASLTGYRLEQNTLHWVSHWVQIKFWARECDTNFLVIVEIVKVLPECDVLQTLVRPHQISYCVTGAVIFIHHPSRWGSSSSVMGNTSGKGALCSARMDTLPLSPRSSEQDTI